MNTSSQKKDNLDSRATESDPLLGNRAPMAATEPAMRLGKCWDSSRRLQVDLLAGLFGVSAWLSVNALFTQLPILVQSAPEGWNLPSFLTVPIQLANIGPVLYSLSRQYWPRLVSDSKLIYFILFLGSSSLLIMTKYYDYTVPVAGEPYSVVLFILSFCIAIVGCTSSVLFIPFMNHYPEVYLISYMVGEGLSGFLPSIISLVQGVGGNPYCVNATSASGEAVLVPHTPPPRFSSGVFFFIIFSIMAVSTVAFFLLNNLKSCKEQKLRKPSLRERAGIDSPSNAVFQDEQPFTETSETRTNITPLVAKVLLAIQMIVSMFANGALPSIQSYSCLPYGNLAYHFAVNLGNMANPAACFLAFFVPHTSTSWIVSLFLVSNLATCFVLTTAIFSPHPPLQGQASGTVLIVLGWVACSGLISYVKMSIAAVFRREGGRGLFWYGAVTQIGAVIGSIVMFYLINRANLFTPYNPCS